MLTANPKNQNDKRKGKITMEYYNTHDEKIMNYGGDCYKDLVAEFTSEEVAEMRHYLEKEYDYDYSYLDSSEMAECIVIDYIREWLIENIRQFTINGTEQLFKLVYLLA